MSSRFFLVAFLVIGRACGEKPGGSLVGPGRAFPFSFYDAGSLISCGQYVALWAVSLHCEDF